jgi:hypothetical protein
LAGILLYPWMETSPRGRGLLAAFGLVVLGVAVRVVRKSPWATWLAFVLAALVVGLFVLEAVSSHPALPVAGRGARGGVLLLRRGKLIAYMMQDWVATTDELFAAGATFTLLVWAFAYTYLACEAVAPGSFTAPINPQGPRTWMELMFLSIAVLSGVGLSDILPLHAVRACARDARGVLGSHVPGGRRVAASRVDDAGSEGAEVGHARRTPTVARRRTVATATRVTGYWHW